MAVLDHLPGNPEHTDPTQSNKQPNKAKYFHNHPRPSRDVAVRIEA